MRAIDADALINEIKKETEKAIERDDKVDSFWLGYIAGLVIKQPTIQPVVTDTNVGDTISKFIDGLEEIFADLRERHVDDSVCGLCEYDGAYMGQSGNWCNECPGFDRDDCFKLSDKTRKKWTDEIIKALPPAQPEPQWIPVSERLPEKGGEYLVSVRWYLEDDIDIDVYDYDARCKEWNDGESCGQRVIAWMPLPVVYKPNK